MPYRRKRPRKRYALARPRRRYGRGLRGLFRRHKPKKIPLIPTIAFGAATIAGSSGSWGSPLKGFMDGNPMAAMQSAIRNLTGMQIGMPGTGYTSGFQWDIWGSLNPFNPNEAVGLKGLMYGSIADVILGAIGAKRKVQPMLDKIPFVGKKFSL